MASEILSFSPDTLVRFRRGSALLHTTSSKLAVASARYGERFYSLFAEARIPTS